MLFFKVWYPKCRWGVSLRGLSFPNAKDDFFNSGPLLFKNHI